MPQTYLDFHLFFVVPPVALLLAVAVARRGVRRRVEWAGVGLLVCIALVYTTPWDNYLIARDVWEYGPDTVARRLWLAPVEEYAFIVLQTIAAGLWLYVLAPLEGTAQVTRRDRVLGVAAGGLVGVGGLALLVASGRLFYLAAIVIWAAPVLALQWGFGWPYLWRYRRRVALGALLPTLYFATADRIAIENGIWSLSSTRTSGVEVAGLPVEEGAFFLVTSLFVVQGLLLYAWIIRR